LAALPDLPTLSEQSVTDFEVTVWHGIYAPKNLPKDVSDRLVKALQDAVGDPAFKESMQKLGAIPASKENITPEGLARKLRSEVDRWTPLIQAAEAYID